MSMDSINRDISQLLTTIRDSDIYKEYKKQEKILNRNPDLWERVEQFCTANYRIQESEHDATFEIMEKLRWESAELRRIPEVNAYLDAELALCKLMQTVTMNLMAGIDMHIPGL